MQSMNPRWRKDFWQNDFVAPGRGRNPKGGSTMFGIRRCHWRSGRTAGPRQPRNPIWIALMTCAVVGLTAAAPAAGDDPPPNWRGTATGTTRPEGGVDV